MPGRDGYIGDSLFGAMRALAGVTDGFMKTFAEAVGDEFHFLVVQNTPVETGLLKRRWNKRVTSGRATGGRFLEATVWTSVEYAPDVEYGTGLWGPRHAKYPIRPKNPGGWLSWVDPKTGKRQFRKLVMHPGSPGRQMVRLAIEEVAATLVLKFQREARRWQIDAEVAMKRRARERQVRS